MMSKEYLCWSEVEIKLTGNIIRNESKSLENSDNTMVITYQVHQNLSNSRDKRQSWPWTTAKHEGAIF